MIEQRGDMFLETCDALCVTTNGFVKSNGRCVMGKGCAKQLADLDERIPAILGAKIKFRGNVVQEICKKSQGDCFVAFPVKPKWREYRVEEDVVKHMRSKFKVGDKVPGWASTAVLSIITQSAKELVKMADERGWKKVVLPRMGCGAGELGWTEVKKEIETILDDRFVIMTW